MHVYLLAYGHNYLVELEIAAIWFVWASVVCANESAYLRRLVGADWLVCFIGWHVFQIVSAMMEDFTCAFWTDGRIQTDRQTDSLHRLGVKNEDTIIWANTWDLSDNQIFDPSLHKCPGSQELSWSHTQSMHVHDDSDQHSDLASISMGVYNSFAHMRLVVNFSLLANTLYKITF